MLVKERFITYGIELNKKDYYSNEIENKQKINNIVSMFISIDRHIYILHKYIRFVFSGLLMKRKE